MLEEYKAHYLKQNKNSKQPSVNWNAGYRHLENIFVKYSNEKLTLKIIKEVMKIRKNWKTTIAYRY